MLLTAPATDRVAVAGLPISVKVAATDTASIAMQKAGGVMSPVFLLSVTAMVCVILPRRGRAHLAGSLINRGQYVVMRQLLILTACFAATSAHAGEASFERLTDVCCMKESGGAVCPGETWLVGLTELYAETTATGEKVYFAAYNRREPEEVVCSRLEPYDNRHWGGGVEY